MTNNLAAPARRVLQALSHAKAPALAALIAATASVAMGQPITAVQMNVFTSALMAGEASTQVPEGGVTAKAIESMKAMAHDNGPIFIHAKRLVRFEQQSKCGRISFEVVQPSSGKSWPQLSGQFNICENGTPPLQVCKGAPGKLIPANARCADLSAPQNTPEVESAIQNALANGQQTGEQARQRAATQKKAGKP